MSEVSAITAASEADTLRLSLAGSWTVIDARRLDAALAGTANAETGVRRVEVDLAGVDALDTAGAWLIHRTARDLAARGLEVAYTGVDSARQILLEAVARGDREPVAPRRNPPAIERFIVDTGDVVINSWRDAMGMITLVGNIVVVLGGYLLRPWRLRTTSIVFHLEHMALRAVPIIVLISFLIGCIIAQQGAYQLRAFGAEIFTIDLAGILILREIGVLLTAIMVAGRSGSAITAELGSMKMREEIDAMRTLALNPIEVLVVPRLIALIIALPLLTFIADLAALAGAALITWIYIGITPSTFIAYLHTAIALNTFLVGLIKAPFMALIIGMTACMEGLKVQGSAESLGRQTTAAVVKSIFLVIVLDGIFAMLFAAIDY